MNGKEGAGAVMEPDGKDFREEFQGQYGQTVDKVEGIKTELQIKELKEFADQVDKDIAYLEEYQEQVCNEELGADWKSNPDIAPLLATETAGGEEGEPEQQ